MAQRPTRKRGGVKGKLPQTVLQLLFDRTPPDKLHASQITIEELRVLEFTVQKMTSPESNARRPDGSW